jgi:MarR family transcriptional regulator, organic hydroperoxide resistance regulator
MTGKAGGRRSEKAVRNQKDDKATRSGLKGPRSRTPQRKRGLRPEAAKTVPVMPLTVSRRELLEGSTDGRFRTLVHDLLTISARMELVRAHLGARLGLTGPQYSVLVAVAHLQREAGASVTAVANALHVSNAFVASETGKLAQHGLVHKRVNPHDRRGVLLTIAPKGRLEIAKIGAEIRAINDLFFGALDAGSFPALSAAIGALVGSSRRALHYLRAGERGQRTVPEAAE